MQWKVDTQGLHSVMLEFAADNGDAAGIDHQVAWSRGTPAESHILQEAGSVALAAGQVHRAEILFAEAHAAAARDNVVDALVDLDEYHVRMLVDLGLTANSQALLKTMPASDPSMDKAFTEAEVGSAEAALQAARQQQAAAPTDTLMNAEYVPSVQAAIALRGGNPQQAVDMLRSAEPYEMRDPTVPYLRGQAFLAAHQGAEAEAEFKKLAGQPWLADPAAPLIELSELGLARALALRGETEASIAAYHRFLADWSTADSSLPVIEQAQSELRHLEPARQDATVRLHDPKE
jgi:predicted Zn-dependent protease